MAPEARLPDQAELSLPIVMVREFPFVEGRVGEVHGKWMLDTGMEQAMVINDHRVPLTEGRLLGTGFFGSGQKFAIRLNAQVADIQIGNLTFPRVSQVESQDATQLEGITPDFMGWVGYTFWQGAALKMDYRKLRATFYRDGRQGYLRGEQLIAELPFEVRKLPNQPLIPVRLGGIPAIAAFDTGQYGALYVDAKTKQALLDSGVLKATGEEGQYDLSDFTMADETVHGVRGIQVNEEQFPAAVPIGITERNILTIGFGFLHNYKTVWDFPQRKIYLLKP